MGKTKKKKKKKKKKGVYTRDFFFFFLVSFLKFLYGYFYVIFIRHLHHHLQHRVWRISFLPVGWVSWEDTPLSHSISSFVKIDVFDVVHGDFTIWDPDHPEPDKTNSHSTNPGFGLDSGVVPCVKLVQVGWWLEWAIGQWGFLHES